MTQLSKEEHRAMMGDMQAFNEQMPCVGIFWTDWRHPLYVSRKQGYHGIKRGDGFPTSYCHLRGWHWCLNCRLGSLDASSEHPRQIKKD